ncbi:hypothetical protein N9525_06855, partial [Flavobacteriaceae bacterium]|nr:hypothetical protein [Flavobacteriaceae bacterium]
MLLEDGKEESYLKLEENWQKVNEALVADGYITQWSVWKRTPRANDEGWAQYFVMIRRNAKQDKMDQNNWEKAAAKAFKGKSKKAINRMLSNEGIVKEMRSRTYKVDSSTGWRGLEWEIGDKAYFHYMTQKNEDFVAYETAVWKPIAQQQILDGYIKYWGLSELIGSNDATKALESTSTHIAFNFPTKKENTTEFKPAEDFLGKKAWNALLDSREMLPAEELTLIYSTF